MKNKIKYDTDSRHPAVFQPKNYGSVVVVSVNEFWSPVHGNSFRLTDILWVMMKFVYTFVCNCVLAGIVCLVLLPRRTDTFHLMMIADNV